MQAMGNFANFNITYKCVMPKDGFSWIFAIALKRYEYRTVYFETRTDQFEIRNIDHSSFGPFYSKFEM